MRKCTSLLVFALAVESLAAQTPVELTYQEMNLWEHAAGPRLAIHTDMDQLSFKDRMFGRVDLDVIVSTNGQVLQAHATQGPSQFYEQAESIEQFARRLRQSGESGDDG